MSIGKRKRKLIKILIVVVILIIAGVILDKQINKPDQGTIIDTQADSQTSGANTSFSFSPDVINGTYATFNYPKVMTIMSNSGISGSEVAAYTYKYKDIQTWILAIEILKIPSGNLNDNSSWQFRKDNPGIYQETDDTINGQAVRVMADTSGGGFSKVAFLVDGQYQATVSLTGDDPDGTGNLSSVFNLVLNSWHWNQ